MEVKGEYDGSDVLQHWFIYGNYIDEVLRMTDSDANDYYYVHDHLYSPVALTSWTIGHFRTSEDNARRWADILDDMAWEFWDPTTGFCAGFAIGLYAVMTHECP